MAVPTAQGAVACERCYSAYHKACHLSATYGSDRLFDATASCRIEQVLMSYELKCFVRIEMAVVIGCASMRRRNNRQVSETAGGRSSASQKRKSSHRPFPTHDANSVPVAKVACLARRFVICLLAFWNSATPCSRLPAFCLSALSIF